jgi:hypothetical protein
VFAVVGQKKKFHQPAFYRVQEHPAAGGRVFLFGA